MITWGGRPTKWNCPEEIAIFQNYRTDYKHLDTSSTVWENSLEGRIPKTGLIRWFMLNSTEETWVKPQSLKSHPGTGDCQEDEGSAASSSFNDVHVTKGGLGRNSITQTQCCCRPASKSQARQWKVQGFGTMWLQHKGHPQQSIVLSESLEST